MDKEGTDREGRKECFRNNGLETKGNERHENQGE
jgi:hypothetical protein